MNTWFAIGGTAGAGGASIDAFSGLALKDATSELISAAAGGHGVGHDNRVVSIALTDDAPAWRLRHAPSPDGAADAAYYADGLPSARHTYQSIFFVPQVNRVMLIGRRYTHPGGGTGPEVDGFNLDTNTWDRAGTWANVPIAGDYGQAIAKGSGDIYTSQLLRWSPVVAGAWTSVVPSSRRVSATIRFPIAHDWQRNQLFTLQVGDGQGFNTGDGLQSSVVNLAAGTQSLITFNASDALTAFLAERPEYMAMDFDPDHGRYLVYTGVAPGTIYVVMPNAGTTWDMSVLPLSGNSVVPRGTSSGIQNRFKYVPALGGFVLLVSASQELHFIRTVA